MENRIHPTALLGPNVKLGLGNVIGAFVCIEGEVVIGDDNTFDSHCTIGGPAEFRGRKSGGAVVIGSNNHFGEGSNVHQSLEPETATHIGNDCYIMCHVHVGHDASIEDEATLSSGCIIGGHSVVCSGANIGLGAVVHQKRVVGKGAMIGMNSTVTKSIPPFMVAWGSPCTANKVNIVGLQRRGEDPRFIEAVTYWLNKKQTGLDIRQELTYLVEERMEVWEALVKNLGGK
jgi:UDP-N-acetylglucosamine acyltransferase